jgi:hypothetical protein
MRSITSLLAGLVALATFQPTAEASHKHNTACKHGGKQQNTVVVRPGGYSSSKNHNHNHNHKHSSTNVVVVTSTPTYTYYPYYGYRRYYYVNPTPTYAQPPQPVVQQTKPVVQNTKIREVGARFVGGGSVEGEQTALVGAGAYLRLRNSSRYLGFEASVDSTTVLDQAGNAIANQIPVQAAALLYLNPQSPLRLFGVAGGGLALEQSAVGTSQNITAQIGGGIDLDFSSRATFTLDVRGLATESATTETRILPVDPVPNTNVLMNMGLSIKF